MTFYEFLELENYPIGDRKQYMEAFEAFLKSTQITPFFDAIMRSASSSAKEELKSRLFTGRKQAWVAFEEFLPAEKRRNIEIWSDIWDELTRSTGFFAPYKISDHLLHQGFFFSAHERLLDIQRDIMRVGQIALKKEHDTALMTLAEGDKPFYSFDEYVSAAWQAGCNNRVTVTLHQRLGYLAYLENLTQHFNKPSQLYSENKNQAQLMHAEIQKWRSIVQERIEKLESLSAVLVANKKNHAKKSQELSRLKHLIRQEPPSSTQIRDNASRLESEIKQLSIEEAHIKDEIQTHTAYLDDVSDEISANMERYQSYWRTNLPRILNRAEDINRMLSITSSAPRESKDILFRNITEGEYKHLVHVKQFSQAPKVCLEREKWFYMDGGNPGANVTHPILCKIYLCPGASEMIKKLAKPDGQFAAVVTKIAEPLCYGIHEDALPALNSMIERVEFYRTLTMIAEVKFERHAILPMSRENLSLSCSPSPRYL